MVLVHFFLLISYSYFIKLHYKTDVCKTKLARTIMHVIIVKRG